MKKKTHIGLAAEYRYPPPATDGITVFSDSLIRALSELKSDYHFTVFVSDNHRHLISDLGDNFSLESIPSSGRHDLTDIFWYFFRLPILARRHHIDLLHLFAGDRRLSLFPFSRSVVTIHDIYNYRYMKENPIKKHLFFRYILSPLLKAHPRIVTVGRHVKSEIHEKMRIPLKNISVIPNGYDQKHFFPIEDGSAKQDALTRYGLKNKYLLYVSNIDHPRKNHINLIKAYAMVCKNSQEPQDLVLVGKLISGFSKIRQTIRKLHLETKIKILGSVGVEQLAVLYNGADIFVHPSVSEGFGLPILEAMACGVPVACSDIPAFQEVAGANALFFDPYDPESICQSLEKLNSDEKIRCRLSINGIKLAKRYTWKNTAKNMLVLYDSILNGQGRDNGPYKGNRIVQGKGAESGGFIGGGEALETAHQRRDWVLPY